jgi:hypothetical protein
MTSQGMKFLIAAMLMLGAVHNGRADDQAPPARNPVALAPIQYPNRTCGAAFYKSDLSSALPVAFPAVLCPNEPVRAVRYQVPREHPVAPPLLAASSRPHCPKIIMGDDRALICGYLAQLYDLYCCK